jgi:NAD(P)-dependent dehydrogenase (short-subunit alcohol dehydrogenase family)
MSVSGGDLQGRVAIVTGASRGIGLAIAESLVAAGARVVITGRCQESAQQAAAGIGDRAIGFAAHAADEEAARDCAELAIERFGSLDILVNNAGINPAFGPLLEVDKAPFEKTLEVNLWAPVMWTRICWEAWMREHGGVVVNTSSVGGVVVGPDLGVYNASKAALIHVTKQLALELAPQVRVNAVAPGIVRTKFAEALWKQEEERVAAENPSGRIGEPQDVGEVVAFLAGDRAAWVTGQTLVVDGGQTLGPPESGEAW